MSGRQTSNCISFQITKLILINTKFPIKLCISLVRIGHCSMGVLCFWLEPVTDFVNIQPKDFLYKQVGLGLEFLLSHVMLERINKDNLYLGG